LQLNENMNIKVLSLLLIVIIAGFAACKATGDIAPVLTTTNLNIVNADTNALNFYQNGSRLNQISSLAPSSESGYITVSLPPTPTIYQFKIAGSSNYLINGYELTLDTFKYHSLFAAGETADKVFLVTDVAPASGTVTQAAIRFVNASPATTGLTVSFNGGPTFANQAFKSASGFTLIGSGIVTYPQRDNNFTAVYHIYVFYKRDPGWF